MDRIAAAAFFYVMGFMFIWVGVAAEPAPGATITQAEVDIMAALFLFSGLTLKAAGTYFLLIRKG